MDPEPDAAPPAADAPRLVELQARQLAILAEIARLATADLELRPMLQRITDALARKFEWEFVAFVRVDLERSRFVCEALTSTLPTDVSVGYGRELGSGVVGEVAATGRPILLDDVRAHRNYVETLPGALAELCVPVKHRGRLVAILNLESTRLAAFRHQLPLLETVAEQVGGLIASARLYEEIRRRADHLEILSEVSRRALEAAELAPLLDSIADYVQRRFRLTLAAILISDEAGAEFETRAFAGQMTPQILGRGRWPASHGVVGRAIRTGQEQLVVDVAADPDYFSVNERVRAEFVVPIRFRDRVLGAFNFESDTAEVFAAENLAVLRTLADQVAGAIHLATVNRRLAAATRQLEETNLELQGANQALERLSRIDALTGVANRRCFDESLDGEWRRALRVRGSLSLLLLDIDCFKAFNDAYGHLHGDASLRRVAETLRLALHRAGDLVARYGGEEFAVVLPGMEGPAALILAESLRLAVAALGIPHAASTVAPHLTLSAGAATLYPGLDRAPADLIAAADRALYRAKQGGRNRVEAAPPSAGPPRPDAG